MQTCCSLRTINYRSYPCRTHCIYRLYYVNVPLFILYSSNCHGVLHIEHQLEFNNDMFLICYIQRKKQKKEKPQEEKANPSENKSSLKFNFKLSRKEREMTNHDQKLPIQCFDELESSSSIQRRNGICLVLEESQFDNRKSLASQHRDLIINTRREDIGIMY